MFPVMLEATILLEQSQTALGTVQVLKYCMFFIGKILSCFSHISMCIHVCERMYACMFL